MKKKYINPTLFIYNINVERSILAGSDIRVGTNSWSKGNEVFSRQSSMSHWGDGEDE